MEMNHVSITIAPSVICTDLCNLEQEMRALEDAGAELLHVDFIDGCFSPCLPIGIDTIRALRRCTALPMSLHLMTEQNEFFLDLLDGILFTHIVFHWETARHADRLINKIHSLGMKAGVALTPGTPVTVLEYVLEKCDVITLMLINPGYAHEKEEAQVPYAQRKIKDMKAMIEARGSSARIEIDGRIRTEQISAFASAGADIIVSGSSGVFSAGHSYKENYRIIQGMLSSCPENVIQHYKNGGNESDST